MQRGSLVAALLLLSAVAAAQPPASPVTPATDREIERFLLDATVVRSRSAGKGVTGSQRATLILGAFTHDAHVQTVEEESLRSPSGRDLDVNFRDSWKYNVATYRLDRLLGLGLVPVSVERRWRGTPAAWTWWVDDVMMDELERLSRKLPPRDVERWNQQMAMVRLLDQLIYNLDRNVGNLLITRSWRIWAIDHTRAFRRYHQLKKPADLTQCDRAVLERLRTLDRETVTREVGRYLTRFEIDALLARRDAIVALFDKAGPSALFDRRPEGTEGTEEAENLTTEERR